MMIDDGSIRMCPEATSLFFSPAQITELDCVQFKGHVSAITCLYIPDPDDCLDHKYLFSASQDGTVIIWNME